MGFYRDHCIYLPAMLGWFLFSALLSTYNKMVFGRGHLAFPCPLLLTSIHFLLQWVFSWSLCSLFPKYFGGDTVSAMSWRSFLSTSVPCGLVTSGDVGLSNLSLVRISITFYTMVKASTPIFVLAWAYVLGIERITWTLLLVVAVIAIGELLTVKGEVHFDFWGFILCLLASCLSGARWTLVQLKLHTLEPPLKTTIATLRVISPSMFFSMLLISFCTEKPWVKLSSGYFETFGEAIHTFGLGAVGGVFAIAMILCEFHLIMRASAVILMIGGVIKEMITIIIGVEYFKDELNRVNEIGCAIVFLGVVLYKVSYHFSHSSEEDELISVSTEKIQYRPVAKNGDTDNETAPLEAKSSSLELGGIDTDEDSDEAGEVVDHDDIVRHRIV